MQGMTRVELDRPPGKLGQWLRRLFRRAGEKR